ncbi:MAG: PssD/Cps14F family polysaccharide biosynthesis glycosyltransferase [Candidatus Thermoplasmatota archaeon]
MRLCLVSSAGGHLLQLTQLENVYERYEHFFLTVKRDDAISILEGKNAYYLPDPSRSVILHISNFFNSLRIFLVEKPDVVITTGAGFCLPICIIAFLFRKKIFFIESFSRVFSPSAFGKLVNPLATLTIVQWKEMKKYYRKCIYGGPIFSFKKFDTVGKHIFITVGTHTMQFDRLVKEMDRIAYSLNEKIIAQIGSCNYVPKNFEFFRYAEQKRIEEYIKNSKLVITHGGIGSIILSLKYSKPTIVVPRYKKFGEHVDEHQTQITKAIEKIIIPVYDIKLLEDAIKKSLNFEFEVDFLNGKVNELLLKFLEEMGDKQ